MLFGKFNPLIDEIIHVLLSLLISMTFFFLETINLTQFLSIFLVALLIDTDHLLNSVIARLLGLNAYDHTIIYGNNGITIKILHGFDLFFITCIILLVLTQDFYFSLALFLNLCMHEFWDYIVYPHTWKELFLTTRILSNFKPGERKNRTGLIFRKETLKY